MIKIYPLYRLQQHDLKIDRLDAIAGANDGSGEIQKKIRFREKKALEADKSLHALRIQLKDTELKLASVESHIKDLEKKLYSGSATHAKELAGYNQEIDLLKKQKSGMEDTVLELMDQVEAATAELATIRVRVEKAKKELEEHMSKSGASKHDAELQGDDLRKKRESLTADIEPSLLARYESLRSRKEGIAVAKIDHNACGECGTEIVESIKRRVHDRQLEYCPYCERILFTD